MALFSVIQYELKILTRKLRTYVVLGALFFHFFDINPARAYQHHHIPEIPDYVINETTFFIIEFASIWAMFLIADIMLKEKNLKMKEILYTKPIKNKNIFLGKFSACFLSISAMVGLIFIVAWISELYMGYSPNLTVYIRNYILDVLPMMIFSVSTVVLLSMVFRNTKITYVVYFVYFFLNSSLIIQESFPRFSSVISTYYSNAHFHPITLREYILLKGELLLLSFTFIIISSFLYSYFSKEGGGFS